MQNHQYELQITWTGNQGTGTNEYTSYERSHRIEIKNKMPIEASSDTPFRGDGTKHNPEDFLLASLSSCHMLWYLHLCADAGIIVTAYTDNALGTLSFQSNGIGSFSKVILRPVVTISDSSMIEKAQELHHLANKKCFIANSVNFKVNHFPEIKTS